MMRRTAILFCLITLVGGVQGQSEGPKLPSVSPDKTGPTEPRSAADRIREERQKLAAEREGVRTDLENDDSSSAERKALKKKLDDILDRMSKKPVVTPMPPAKVEKKDDPKSIDPPVVKMKDSPAAKTDVAPPTGTKPLEAMARAQNLYRAGEMDSALAAYKAVDIDGLARDDKLLVQYMTACCLRRLNRLSEAAAIYREVASAEEDPFLSECALWHLSSIRWRQDLEKQLGDMKNRRESLKP